MINREKIVMVFKTSIQDLEMANAVIKQLDRQSEILRITFDLEDIDKILRVEATKNISSVVISQLENMGLLCQELE